MTPIQRIRKEQESKTLYVLTTSIWRQGRKKNTKKNTTLFLETKEGGKKGKTRNVFRTLQRKKNKTQRLYDARSKERNKERLHDVHSKKKKRNNNNAASLRCSLERKKHETTKYEFDVKMEEIPAKRPV